MKANEAPEKIYVDSKAIGDDISTTVNTKRQNYSTCTEYTRTDAFIEKATEFLEEHLIDYLWSQGAIDESDFIDDFKNYMKGE